MRRTVDGQERHRGIVFHLLAYPAARKQEDLELTGAVQQSISQLAFRIDDTTMECLNAHVSLKWLRDLIDHFLSVGDMLVSCVLLLVPS